jgi:hypothetical protein
MRARVVMLLAVAATLAMAALIACGTFSGAPPDPAAEAGADASVEPLEAGAVDAEPPLPPHGGCTIVDEKFDGMQDAGWTFFGGAQVSGGELELVADVQGQAGAIWLKLPVPLTSFHARFTAGIVSDAGLVADGLTLAWSTKSKPVLGGTGGSIGICNKTNDGLAVFLNPLGRRVDLATVKGTCQFESEGGTTFTLGGEIDVDVTVTPGQVTGRIDGAAFTFATNTIDPILAIGFTAATGDFSAQHTIDNIVIDTCPP